APRRREGGTMTPSRRPRLFSRVIAGASSLWCRSAIRSQSRCAAPRGGANVEGETYVIEGDTFAVFDPLGGLSAAHATAIAACAAFRRTARDCPADPRRALLDANE